MNKYPNLRHLSIALHINKTHGFSGVSKIVHLSPSAITQAMRGLENSLGNKIFDRSPSGAYPNELGTIYLNRIQLAFDALALAEKAIDTKNITGVVKSHLSVSQLRAVIAVIHSGSYSLAARRLELSQPSVYKAARSVEDLFGKRLFRPSSSGVEPTKNAREFARHASIALSEIERAQEEILEFQDKMQGRLAIGTLPLIRTRVLPRAVNRLLEIYPDARVQIVAGVYADLLDALRHGEIDLLLGALRKQLPARDVEQTSLFTDNLSIIVRHDHPILSITGPTLSDLAELDWIIPRTGTPTRDYFEETFSKIKLKKPLKKVECSSFIAIRAMLFGNNSATILSAHQAEYEIERGDLAVVNCKLMGSNRHIGVTKRANWIPTKLQSQFLSILDSESTSL